jgi:hypothetical protein
MVVIRRSTKQDNGYTARLPLYVPTAQVCDATMLHWNATAGYISNHLTLEAPVE